MKILFYILFSFSSILAFSQTQSFDIISFTAPKGWKKSSKPDMLQYIKEDAAKGTYCIINLYKSIDGTADPKENFDLAWQSLAKEALDITVAPEMQPAVTYDGWEVQSGHAVFEKDGTNGLAMLITSTSNSKMVNMLILTNSDAYESETTKLLESVQLKKVAAVKKNEKNSNDLGPDNTQRKSGFTFSTTNFDDGWTAVEKPDWVEVSKGNIRVLIHYPRQGTVFPADPAPLTNAAWDILVAPRYSNLKNYKTSYISTYNQPYLGMGYAVENATSKEVFILLFRQGTEWLEFITPDKNSFIQQFKFDPETIRWDSEPDLLIPLATMNNYNKFAVAAADFSGTWTSSYSGFQQLYNVYTGLNTGALAHQSSQEFAFNGSNYNWNIISANGIVGNQKFSQAKSSGKLTVLNNWQVNCSNIEGKPKKYNAYFSCLKGARLLHLLDADFPGSGIYTVFGKK